MPKALSRLILLGTVHRDPAGYRKMKDFLQRLQPDAVLLEMSPYAAAFRKNRGPALVATFRKNLREASEACGLPLRNAIRHPEVAAIGRQLALPFEYRAASAYVSGVRGTRSRDAKHAGNGNAKLFLVDRSSFSRRMIAAWPELISVENLKALLAMDFPAGPSIDKAYERAWREIHGAGRPRAGEGSMGLATTAGGFPDEPVEPGEEACRACGFDELDELEDLEELEDFEEHESAFDESEEPEEQPDATAAMDEDEAEDEGEMDRLWLRRERFLAGQVRGVLLDLGPERPVYIGGWRHLSPCVAPPTLRALLGVPPSRCLLLRGERAVSPRPAAKIGNRVAR